MATTGPPPGGPWWAAETDTKMAGSPVTAAATPPTHAFIWRCQWTSESSSMMLRLPRTWPEGSAHARLRQLYQDLLAARRQWPALRDRRHTAARLVIGDGRGHCDVGTAEGGCATRPAILLLQRGGDDGLLAVANLAAEPVPLAALKLGGGHLLLSTEDARYGGARHDDHSCEEILPYELLVFASGDQL